MNCIPKKNLEGRWGFLQMGGIKFREVKWFGRSTQLVPVLGFESKVCILLFCLDKYKALHMGLWIYSTNMLKHFLWWVGSAKGGVTDFSTREQDLCCGSWGPWWWREYCGGGNTVAADRRHLKSRIPREKDVRMETSRRDEEEAHWKTFLGIIIRLEHKYSSHPSPWFQAPVVWSRWCSFWHIVRRSR